MIDEILEDANERMGKSVDSLQQAFARIRTGRAHPSLLDTISLEYYGADTPLNQVASISVEDGRTLEPSRPGKKPLLPEIEKAILRSDLGITPISSGDVVRVPLPPLTEENRRDLAKQAKQEAEERPHCHSQYPPRCHRPTYGNWSKKKRRRKDRSPPVLKTVCRAIPMPGLLKFDAALSAKEADLMEI